MDSSSIVDVLSKSMQMLIVVHWFIALPLVFSNDSKFYNSAVSIQNRFYRYDIGDLVNNDNCLLSSHTGRVKRNADLKGSNRVVERRIKLRNGNDIKMRLNQIKDTFMYKGYLIGKENLSFVHGSLIEDSFTGKVCTHSNGCYYVEPLNRFINTAPDQSNKASIVYRASDVIPLSNTDNIDEKSKFLTLVRDSKPINAQKDQNSNIKISQFPNNRSCCYLYLRTDEFLWNEVFHKEGQRNSRTTELYIINMLHQIVAAANQIYRRVIFQRRSSERAYRGFQLKIKRIKILQPQDCVNDDRNVNDNKHRLLCNPNLDVLDFLNAHSQEDASEYCLSYTFTARNFQNGTLGLAWSGKSKFQNSSGGICNKDSKDQSFNGGIVTVLNFRTRVTMRTLELTFAHEIGHNLGAEHDSREGPCAPHLQNGGSFLMHSDAVETGGSNNDKFSSCSLQDISDTMVAMINNELRRKPNCLAECDEKYCGNRIVEDGEQCDCGFEEDCRSLGDTCCYPADSELFLRCKLKENAICSRSQGSCCASTCTFETNKQLCYKSNEQDCLYDTFCSGTSSTCPTNDYRNFRADQIFCQNFTKICQSGQCAGSICELTDKKYQCFLGENVVSRKITEQSKLCHLGCSSDLRNGICQDTFDMEYPINPNTGVPGFLLQTGSACAHGRGYCDVSNLCRTIDNDGPLSRLTRLLLNRNNLKDIVNVLSTYWWAVLLCSCLLLLITTYTLEKCGLSVKQSIKQRPKRYR
ncbi:hypothetical protein GJ496_005463 [Pomphorhynchus laevis]|nr:hypothetical protein GJ496_005463 [Pomphorhynchus laevis]